MSSRPSGEGLTVPAAPCDRAVPSPMSHPRGSIIHESVPTGKRIHAPRESRLRGASDFGLARAACADVVVAVTTRRRPRTARRGRRSRRARTPARKGYPARRARRARHRIPRRTRCARHAETASRCGAAQRVQAAAGHASALSAPPSRRFSHRMSNMFSTRKPVRMEAGSATASCTPATSRTIKPAAKATK